MKFLIGIFSVCSLLYCRPYKQYNSDKTNVDIRLYSNKVAGLSQGAKEVTHFKQLPWRWRKSELFKYSTFTYDSLAFDKQTASELFLRATYDRKKHEGTVVYQSKNAFEPGKYIYCIVFKAKKGYYNSHHYYLHRKPNGWADLQYLLPTADERIFGGRVAKTKREIRKLRRQNKRYAKKTY